MPVVLKPNELFIKNRVSGEYEGMNVVAEQTTAEQVADIESAGASQITAIENKGAETRDSIPSDYTSLSDEVDDLKSAIDELPIDGLLRLGYSLTSGIGVTWKGAERSNSAVSATDYIDVSNFEEIIYKRRMSTSTGSITDNTLGCAFYDSSKAYISGEPQAQSQPAETYVDRRISVPENAVYFRATVLNTAINQFYVKGVTMLEQFPGLIDTVQSITGIEDAIFTTATGHYISSKGNYTDAASGVMSSQISLTEGQKIIVDWSSGTSTGIGVISKYENSAYTVLKSNASSSANTHFEYIATENMNVIVSWTTTSQNPRTATIKLQSVSDVMVKSSNIVGFETEIKNVINSEIPWQYALDSILCIGDSLTYGVPASTTTMPNPMKQNYPYYLSRMIDAETTNAGVGGITTKEWYTEQYSNYNMTNYNAFIIFLGTNGGLTDSLDTDVEPYDDYHNYANTNTGNYCKLIENIMEDNPNNIMVLVNIWSVASGADTTRTVIDAIGAKYSLPVVDTYDIRYDKNPAYHGGYNNVHLSKAGYLALANRICKTIQAYLTDHVSMANKGMTSN